MTYNIHKCIGGIDRRYRPQRVIETIARCEADIVCLQEVDDGAKRSNGHRQVDLIADELGFKHRAFQRNVKLSQGHYGNAILSRFPLTDVHDIDLTIPLKKRRRALAAHCRIRTEHHTHTLLVFNFHLGLAQFERKIQLRRVLDAPILKRTHKDTGVVIAGDYNDVWGSLEKRFMQPANFRSATKNAKTFPAVLPMRCLDRVFYRGRLQVDHSYVSRTKTAREASDHLPLVVEFILD